MIKFLYLILMCKFDLPQQTALFSHQCLPSNIEHCKKTTKDGNRKSLPAWHGVQSNWLSLWTSSCLQDQKQHQSRSLSATCRSVGTALVHHPSTTRKWTVFSPYDLNRHNNEHNLTNHVKTITSTVTMSRWFSPVFTTSLFATTIKHCAANCVMYK